MQKRKWFSRFLGITGTISVLLPIIIAVLLSVIHFISKHEFILDYLIPAELGFVVLFGASLLLWVVFRVRLLVKRVIWTISIALICLFGSQGLAVITGLASGEIEPSGWQFLIVTGLLVVYDICVIVLGFFGILLIIKIYKNQD